MLNMEVLDLSQVLQIVAFFLRMYHRFFFFWKLLAEQVHIVWSTHSNSSEKTVISGQSAINHLQNTKDSSQ